MIKTRVFTDKNYKGIFVNDRTIRIALDSSQPIQELNFPEFYDVKITDHCRGKCPQCYMDSNPTDKHSINPVNKIIDFFGSMSLNERPFQVAIGGGEPTSHPEFINILETFHKLGIVPNYTTNGMFIEKEFMELCDIVAATEKYCGGVALSCHEHLEKYWVEAAKLLHSHDIPLNFHIIISDKKSIDRFIDIYYKWDKMIDFFVLLPYTSQGRAPYKDIDWDYLCSVAPDDCSKIAFGAGFHKNLLKDDHNFNVSLYDPEILSKFLDLKDMKLYPSSFDLKPIN